MPVSPEEVTWKVNFAAGLEASRRKILEAIGPAPDLSFIRIHGNLGDHLIYAGTRQLLSGLAYREISIRSLRRASGHTALIAGGGSWCDAYQQMPDYLPEVEKRFERVIVLPSSFDVSVIRVKEALASTKALLFAREQESYCQIRELCSAELAYDCAFFFDYRPYQRPGEGMLNAFRTDREGLPYLLPEDNNDISATCESLDEWLWTIARSAVVQTDRAHVTIAAAMLGKRVRYRSSNYHKVPGIVACSLQGFPVEPIPRDELERASLEVSGAASLHADDLAWARDTRLAARDLQRLVPAGESVIVVDDDRLGGLTLADRHVIPFLERGGRYWGSPPDDETAIRELQRLLEARPEAIAIAWPAFWWLDHFTKFSDFLNTGFQCVLRTDQLIVFSLRPAGRTQT